ncbi:hypothetical protein B5807_10304 [Epicoccum nigrum]|uniref:Uncharacterized protein n=1 Tax=Epicoccum nigrum TaxID=105696 RepID=A0A1Y2LPG8_EPING|nr:hypothetical protein B5807_10304 [Epicoccum nigrum]
MSTLTFLALTLTLSLLPHPSAAQDSPQCAALAPALAYNASSTLPIPALNVAWLGDQNDNDIVIRNDTRAEWRLSAYVQPLPLGETPPGPSSRFSTRTTLWLDTGDTNATRLGNTMRMCHNYVPLQVREKVSWSGETLRKSVDDAGDCRALVSEECLARLRVQYGLQAQSQRGSMYNGCQEMNNTVPWECADSGMVSPVTIPNPTFNGTLRSRLPSLASSSAPLNNNADELVCSGRNLSRSTNTLASVQDYELGVTFPIMDIMTFFGTAGSGSIFRSDSFRVHVACLVPGPVTEGSEEKGSVGEVLAMYNITGGEDKESGAQALERGRVAWAVAAWAVVVGAALVV